MPSAARPAANVTACCSAMPTSKRARRKFLLEQIDASAGRHRGGDRDDAVVLPGFADQAFAEHLLVGRRLGVRLVLLARENVEFGNAVILVGAASAGA